MQRETATLAGGCFWCSEAIYQRLEGVHSVLSGYAGGTTINPSYKDVSSGTTGHAESIQIEFDPEILSYADILDIFWHTHDPTTVNQQGNDIGPQYRSIIFYHTPEQKKAAENSKEMLAKEHSYTNPIVTSIIPFTNFYPADKSHVDYYNRNETAPYCQYVITPKIQKLFTKYSRFVKNEFKIK